MTFGTNDQTFYVIQMSVTWHLLSLLSEDRMNGNVDKTVDVENTVKTENIEVALEYC